MGVLNRQDVDPLLTVSGDGIAGTAMTASQPSASLASLAFDDSVTTTDQSNEQFSAPFAETQTEVIATSTSSPATSNSPSPSDNADKQEEIPIGTVVGACVGALAGAIFLIAIGFWLYKRGAPSQRSRGPSRSRSWNKLDEGRDTWEGQYQTKEVAETIAPMEKLTMFKKSPSVRTAYTHKSESDMHHPTFDLGPHPFAQYHPNLAKEMASSEDITSANIKPPFLTDDRAASTISWDSNTGNDSFVSLRPGRMSGEMSPSLDMAIPTPSVTSSVPHRWESAEIVNFDGESAVIVDPQDPKNSNNPFISSVERRKSANNPFFNANSSHHTVPLPKSAKEKGKEKDAGDVVDPFNGSKSSAVTMTHHPAVGSIDSVASNDRAIQSLIAALDVHISPEDVQERLRVASMQPSVVSEMSAFTNDGEEITKEFPLPPGSDSKSS